MSKLTLTVGLLAGLLLAAPAALVAQEKGKDHSAEKKAEKVEQKKKAEKNRLPKDRKARPKEEVGKGVKKETAAATKLEASIKVEIVLLNEKADDPRCDELADKMEAEFAEVAAALDLLEAAAEHLDEAELEAAIDDLTEDANDLAELADDLEDLADELDDEDLYTLVDHIDDMVFELACTIEHLDDLADELDGTIGDDIDVIIVIEIEVK